MPTKVCPGCNQAFSLLELVESPELQPLGMQFVDKELSQNVYYFSHICPSCGTTFVVSVTAFLPLIQEPIPTDCLAGTEACEEHCMAVADLELCSRACRYAPFRRFLLQIRRRHELAVLTEPDMCDANAKS